MAAVLLLLLIISGALFFQRKGFSGQEEDRYTFQSFHMGSLFTIVVYADDRSLAQDASNAAFDRIEELNLIMSDYIERSELNQLSLASRSGKEVKVSDPLFEVLKESIYVSEVTDGFFDVTVGPLTKSWRELRAMPEPVLPDEDVLGELLDRVGFRAMKLDKNQQTVELLKPGMQLDLGGIAKGYAVGEALQIIKQFGIRSALVDGGGDISVGEPPPGRDYWEVALAREQVDGETRFVTINLYNKNVSTSGDMYQFVEIDGQRYSHILNPQTGLGATEQYQATVIAGKGAHADAFASALTLTGPDRGIELVNDLEGVEAVIFKNTDGGLQQWKSDGFKRFMK